MEIFIFLFIITAFFAVSAKIFSAKLLNRVSYRCCFSTDEAFENDEIEFTEEIVNAKLLPVPWLKTELSVSEWLEFPQQQSVLTNDSRIVTSFFSLKGMSRTKRVWKVRCLKRGNFRISSIHTVASDILGMTVLSASPDLSKMDGISVRVLPSPPEISADIADMSILSGDTVVRRKLIHDEFLINGIREYVPGDRISSVNWYATAHERKIMVSKFDCTSCSALTVLLNIQSTPFDVSETVYQKKLENCISFCAGLISMRSAAGMNIRLAANTSVNGVPADCTSSDTLPLLELLADIGTEIDHSFTEFVRSILPSAVNSSVIIVSSYSNDEISEIIHENPAVSVIVPEDLKGETA